MAFKTPEDIKQVEAIKASIAELPDEKDGLDLRQYKMQAERTADQLINQLTAVYKLSA